MSTIIEKAVSFMTAIANDASHGYDQIYRWGEKGDYDCSSLVITAWQNAGVPVKTNGATYTGNMYKVFTSLGFKDVTASCNLSNGSGMQRGDVLLNTVHHTAMYIGNGQIVQASINEKGTAKGGKPGDQKQLNGLKGEINICSYRNYPWNYVLRYQEPEPAKPTIINASVQDNTGAKNMRIIAQEVGDNIYTFKDKENGYYLTASAPAANANVDFRGFDCGDYQKWKIINKTYKLAEYAMFECVACPGLYLSVENNGVGGKNNLKLYTDLHNQKQKFYVREESDSSTLFIHVFSGKCVSCE